MAGKQIEFGEKQTHVKSFEQALLVASLVCIIIVVIAVNVVGGGGI